MTSQGQISRTGEQVKGVFYGTLEREAELFCFLICLPGPGGAESSDRRLQSAGQPSGPRRTVPGAQQQPVGGQRRGRGREEEGGIRSLRRLPEDACVSPLGQLLQQLKATRLRRGRWGEMRGGAKHHPPPRTA